jgi:hypothetical protein
MWSDLVREVSVMLVGVPREVENHEFRLVLAEVALAPGTATG